jgi:hypothetical protein
VRLHELRGGRAAGERVRPGEQLEGQHAPRVEIGARVHLVPHGLLGRHVRGRADARTGARERDGVPVRREGARGPDGLGDAEVGDDRGALVQEHVLGLDVPVHQPLPVRVGERARDVAQDAHRLGGRRGAARHPRAERLASHERHRVEGQPSGGHPGGEQRHDVRLLQGGCEPNLAREALGAEPLGQLGSEHLHDDLAAQRHV